MRATLLAVVCGLALTASSTFAKPPGELVVVEPGQSTAGVGAHGLVDIGVSTGSGQVSNLDVKVDGESVKLLIVVLAHPPKVEGKKLMGGDSLHAYLLPQKAGKSKVTVTSVGADGKPIDREGFKPLVVTINVKDEK